MLKKLIPSILYQKLQPTYHYTLAVLAAILYRFPSRKIKVIGITGTKGKSTTCELVAAILTQAGHKVALSSTVHFKIGDQEKPNLLKMTMPGRFFLQSFIRQAVKAGCDYLVLEMSSEGAKQFRHKFISLDALVFTNLSPEHIESHGSYENYVAAKLKFAYALQNSPKKNKVLVVNGDDPEAEKFLRISGVTKIRFHLSEAESYKLSDEGVSFIWREILIKSPMRGLFNIYNILAAATLAESQKVTPEEIKQALSKVSGVPGRLEKIESDNPKQNFEVLVDYAHTADSLEKVYQALGDHRKICVLGSTGGGRDKWKRPEMGKVAARYCSTIILTNEDPYDEDPEEIIKAVGAGIGSSYKKIMDRREAIRTAIAEARPGEVVIITGKGTDPYIMGPNSTKTPWSDALVAREELKKVLSLS